MKDPAWDGPDLSKGAKLTSFASETVGRISLSAAASKELHGAESMLVQSFAGPIAVETSPGVFENEDTTLELDEDKRYYEPERTNVASRFSESLGGGVTVGVPKSDTALTVKPVGSDVQGTLVGGKKLFFANTGVDTDTVLEATPAGASVAWLLRSPKASKRQALNFELPSGSGLRVTPEGNAEISRGAIVVAKVSAPIAFDAQKTPLPAKFERTKEGVAVSVDVGNGDVAYPIAIDPVISYSGELVVNAGHARDMHYPAGGPNGDAAAWGMTQVFSQFTSNSARAVAVAPWEARDSQNRPVLKIRSAGSTGQPRQYASHLYDPVRSTSVVRIEWQGLVKIGTGTDMYMGIINPGGWLNNQWGAYFLNDVLQGEASSPFGAVQGTSLTTPVTVYNCAMEAVVCPGRRTSAGGTSGENTAAYFSMGVDPGVPADQYVSSLGAFVYLADNDSPTLNLTGSIPQTWKDPGNINATFNVSDVSLGVGSGGGVNNALTWNIDNAGYSATNSAGPICEGGAEDPCPSGAAPEAPVSVTMPTASLRGKHNVKFKSNDIIGHSSAVQEYTMKVDGEAPEIDLSGRLGALALDKSQPNVKTRTIVGSAPYVITARDGSMTGPDGTTPTPNSMRSGVKTLSVKLNKSLANGDEDTSPAGEMPGYSSSKASPSDCDEDNGGTKNSCPLTHSGVFDSGSLAPGIYYFNVTATDYLNHSVTKSFRIGVGVARINGVTEGQGSARYVPLSVSRERGSATQYRIQYRSGTNVNWCEVPYASVQKAADAVAISGWPQNLSGSSGEKLVVDMSNLRTQSTSCVPDSARLADGPVQFRALMEGSGDDFLRASEDVSINYDHGGKDTDDDSAKIGPGSVDLVTGNFSTSATDVSIDAFKSDLTVSRTYDSRYSDKSSVLGPGWTLGIPVESGGAAYRKLYDHADVRLDEWERYPSVEIEGIDGSAMTFELSETANSDGSDKYVPETGLEGLKLKRIPDGSDPKRTAGFVLTDLDSGEVVEFTSQEDSEGFGGWLPTNTSTPAAQGAISYKYRYESGKAIIDTAFSTTKTLSNTATPDVVCGTDWTAIPKGCQALHFNYSGNPLRLQSISLRTFDPDALPTPKMFTIDVAAYEYNNGALSKAYDPRVTPNPLKTEYFYTQASVPNGPTQSLLTGLKPPAEEPFILQYSPLAEDDKHGRLATIDRSALSAGTATTSVRYYIPTTTAAGSAAPFDLTSAKVAEWGQSTPPWMAAAVFAPDQPPNGSPATNYDKASISYLDPLGREVNSGSPGGRLSVTEYDDYGSVTRTLTAENRARAMSESTPAARQSAADRFSSKNEYGDVPSSPQKRRHLVKTLGPEHQMRLDDNTWVQGRNVTINTYDNDGSPWINPSTNEPYDLVTKTVEGAQVGSTVLDTRTTTTDYGSSDAEKAMGIPLLTTTDPGSGNLQIKRKVTVDSDGQTTERFQPNSQSSSAPTTTKIIYYSDGTVSGNNTCSYKPEWLGLPCKVKPGSQPTLAGMPKLPEKTITYNYLRQPRVTTETVTDASGSSKSRTSTKTYDLAGRVTTEAVSSNDGAAAVTTTQHVYDPDSGKEVETKEAVSAPATPKKIVRAYDTLGRLTNYTDAEGHASSTTYDKLSRPLTTNDGKATRTNSYNSTTGDLTSVADSGAGTFSGTYDADGRLTATTLPGGIVRSMNYDAAGVVDYLAYTRTTGCSSNCVLYEQFAVENAHGQYNALWENMQGQNPNNQYYEYDNAGRLTRVQDWRDDSGTYKCIERRYEFDADSNRTAFKVRAESTGGCSGTQTTKSNSYDNDRLTNSGYVYDAFGRITSLPASDSGATGTFSASYYVNDRVRSISQDGLTQSFAMDPSYRLSSKVESGTSTSTESYAYADDSDSPAWTSVTAGSTTAWSRTVSGVLGAEAIQDSSSGVRILISNIRGDVVAQSTLAGALSLTSKVDEFGVPKVDLPTGVKYAFHGSKSREAATPGGIILMGVRLYQPQQGRFLQVDPVLGGTANPYEYPSDPLNSQDLTGTRKARVRVTLGKSQSQKLIRRLRSDARRLRDLAVTDDAIASFGVAGAFETGGLTLIPAGVAFIAARKRAAKATYFDNLADQLTDLLENSGNKGINIVTRFSKGFKNVETEYYARGPGDKACTWGATNFDGKYKHGKGC